MGTVTLTHDCDVERLDSPLAANGPFQDSYIEENSPDANHWDTPEMFAWRFITEKITEEWRSVVVFDLNKFIPADATITAAVWHFYVTQANMVDAALEIRARRTSDAAEVVEDEVTWNVPTSGETWGAEHGQTTPFANLGRITTTGWHTHDFETLVDDAWDNRNGILGFILGVYQATSEEGGIAVQQKGHADPTVRTRCHHLRITYTLADKTHQVNIR